MAWTLPKLTVTVNTATICSEQILAALRDAWPAAELVDVPRRVTGGQWASIHRLRLAGAPEGVPEELVLRVAPHPEMAAKEQAVQAAVAQAGVPTPRIHLTGPAGGPLEGAWAVMDLAPGSPLLGDLDGMAALGRLPQILARLPRCLAAAMAGVHRLDPAPVIRSTRAAAPTAALTVDELWPHLRTAADGADRPDLARAIDRLADGQPSQEAPVICHGDLHPFNLIADGDRLTILDWTGSLIAPAAYDVAFTRLLLRHPPLEATALLRPALAAGGAVAARRFVRSYLRANPRVDLAHLDWYTALHAARIVTDHAAWARAGDPRADHHPWRLVAPAAAAALGRASGVELVDTGGRWRMRSLT
jgi:aminoglycoside phosphotransferase (APT) family kinase protein